MRVRVSRLPLPLDVFNYYAPSKGHRFAVVEQGGEIIESGDNIASSWIKIGAELDFGEMAKAHIDLVLSKCKRLKSKHLTKNHSAASNTGYQSAASNTGEGSAASNTGHHSAASNTGDRSTASNTGYVSAASNTGDRSAASNTGDRSAASVEGKESVAIVTGRESKAKASKGSWIVLTERNDEGEILDIKAAKVGGNNIKADTWYQLIDGKFVEAPASHPAVL